MKAVLFYHSLISDWNHGNAHFLRGISTELIKRGIQVDIYEPCDGWSLANLIQEKGEGAVEEFHRVYPQLRSTRYVPGELDLFGALDGASLVIVHEWNDPRLVRRIGEVRREGDFALFFHDTHHRSLTAEDEMVHYDLSHYDGVLAYGDIIRSIYRERGWHDRIWVWHEAADTNIFKPLRGNGHPGDLVWIGNWGDEERTSELYSYFITPVVELGLGASVYGVRYPEYAQRRFREAGIAYKGWIPNYRVPQIFAEFKATIHIPRRPYAKALHGIPTIRPFEAMACGIPLISAPWDDVNHLFQEGDDYLLARHEGEMKRHIRAVLNDADLARHLSCRGRRTILERHTCAHRVDELLGIYGELKGTRERDRD